MQIEIKELTKKYGEKVALDHFSVTLQPGIYGILGPNGAGKSTLLNILTGNLNCDEGEVFCDGVNILDMQQEYRSRIGYMPQEQICYPQFSLLEFLRYLAILKGLDVKSSETKKQIDDIVNQVNLTDVKFQRIGSFSGGMKRRAILAQALLGNSQLIILDEPTAGLDPKERISMRNMIANLAQDKIVLLATHIASDIECIADQVIIMKNGKLVEMNRPLSLIESVRCHVKRVPCDTGEISLMQKKFRVSNYVQTRDGLVMHIIISEEVEPDPNMDISLDEVYLYYCEEMQEN